MTQAAAAVRQQQSQQRGRAAAALNNLPPELADSSVLDTLAAGVDGPQRGSLSFQKLGAWADLNAFKQVGVVVGAVCLSVLGCVCVGGG